MYVHGATKEQERAIARSIHTAQHNRADLTRKLAGITSEVEALRRARLIIVQAERDARAIREQAYDFGLAQLDRDYPTRAERNRERIQAKNTLVKKYARLRLLAATQEAAEWDRKHNQEAEAA